VEAAHQFTRTGIANKLLSITATEPIFQLAIAGAVMPRPPDDVEI
jgi:hypothetical protein